MKLGLLVMISVSLLKGITCGPRKAKYGDSVITAHGRCAKRPKTSNRRHSCPNSGTVSLPNPVYTPPSSSCNISAPKGTTCWQRKAKFGVSINRENNCWARISITKTEALRPRFALPLLTCAQPPAESNKPHFHAKPTASAAEFSDEG